jgi:hypothetical protein
MIVTINLLLSSTLVNNRVMSLEEVSRSTSFGNHLSVHRGGPTISMLYFSAKAMLLVRIGGTEGTQTPDPLNASQN